MQFKENPLKGSYLIGLQKRSDERGFFARLFCSKEFGDHGLEERFIQANDSLSARKGTLRGMHYQLEPMAETKLVRCLSGSLYDVILDIRPGSPTFGQSFGAVLSAENRLMMYVPKGFAHGFLTLEDNVEVIYFVSQAYSKELERGIRWNDPFFNIAWPMEPEIVSDRDQSHPDFSASHHLQTL